MRRLKVLILSPSLKAENNISGISSITRMLVERNALVDYIHFEVGKRDGQKRNLKWVLYLLMLPIRFWKRISCSTINWVHFNIGFEPFSLVRDFPLFLITRKKGVPVLLHVHGGRFVLNVPQNHVLKWIVRYFLKRSERIIVLSEIEKEALVKGYQIDEGKMTVLPNAVELPHSEKAKVYSPLALSVLYLGRIDVNKGLKEILSALEILMEKDMDFVFYLCGTGPDEQWFLSECERIIGDRLRYEGVIFGDKKRNILEKSHIFLLPSYFEGLPIALLESMSFQLVPVVSGVGAIPKVVRSGENGMIVSTVEDIVNAMVTLDADRDLLRTLSENAEKTVSLQFSIDEYIRKINLLYYDNNAR